MPEAGVDFQAPLLEIPRMTLAVKASRFAHTVYQSVVDWLGRQSNHVSIDVKRTVPAAFTASESFDVGADLGSTVSLEYMKQRPFEFDGKIESVIVELD